MEFERGFGTDLDRFVSSPLAQVLDAGGIGVWNWNIKTGVVSWGVPRADGSVATELTFESFDGFVALAQDGERAELAAALRDVATGKAGLSHSFHLEGDDRHIIKIDAKRFDDLASSHVVGISRSDIEHAGDQERLTALFNERDRVARALETALLPPAMPAVPGLSVDAAYSSGEGAATGDFYDLFPVGGGDWALSIGDVGGHGTAAAAITTSVRYSIRAAALVRRNPTRVLRAANEAHRAAVRDDRFTTCHFVRFRHTAGGMQMRVGTAGHPDLIVRRVSGEVERLAGSGPMLGLMRSPEFKEARTILNVGDIVVAYTDGVTEARRGDEFFGEDGVVEFLRAWSGPVAGFAGALHHRADDFNVGVVRDDMATAVVQVEEMPRATIDLVE